MAEGQVNANKVSGRVALSNQATDAHILFGYQALSPSGAILTGTIPDLGNLGTRVLGDGETYKIDTSYVEHVTFKSKSLAEQTLGTAIANDILYGKTAWVDGELVTGTIDTYIIDTDYAVTLTAGNTYTIPAGYYTNDFEVRAVSLEDQTPGDATSEDITVAKRAWVNGELVIGTMDITSNTQATATPDKMLLGETAWVNGELITGTIPIYRASEDGESVEVKPGEVYNVPYGYYEEGALIVSNETLPFLTGTAVAEDVLEGKSIYIDNALTDGTMKNYGDYSTEYDNDLPALNAGNEYIIEKPGYYNSITIVTAPLAEQTFGTATSGSIMDGRVAYVNGEAIIGTMPIIEEDNITLSIGDTYIIPAGYHNGNDTITTESLADVTPGTALAGDILSGKTAWVNGEEVTGMAVYRGNVEATVNCGGVYTIPAGYHMGSGTVTGASLASQTSADAVAANILTNKTAWVNGVKVVGTMVDRAAVTAGVNCGASYTIPQGYHNGSGKITGNSLSSQTVADAVAADIRTGKTAWVNGSKITGNIGNLEATIYTPGTSDKTIASGKYINGVQTIKGDANLIAENILSGKTIFGVTGSAPVATKSSTMLYNSSYPNNNLNFSSYKISAAVNTNEYAVYEVSISCSYGPSVTNYNIISSSFKIPYHGVDISDTKNLTRIGQYSINAKYTLYLTDRKLNVTFNTESASITNIISVHISISKLFSVKYR